MDQRVAATDTPIGRPPDPADLDLAGLDIEPERLSKLLEVDATEWRGEIGCIADHYDRLGERLPGTLRLQLRALSERLSVPIDDARRDLSADGRTDRASVRT